MELAIILVIVVIIFGVGKVPEIGGALGEGIREFTSESGVDEHGKLTPGETTSATMASEADTAGTATGGAHRTEVRSDDI
jgi:sec-independent protein translocase protein TatA